MELVAYHSPTPCHPRLWHPPPRYPHRTGGEALGRHWDPNPERGRGWHSFRSAGRQTGQAPGCHMESGQWRLTRATAGSISPAGWACATVWSLPWRPRACAWDSRPLAPTPCWPTWADTCRTRSPWHPPACATDAAERNAQVTPSTAPFLLRATPHPPVGSRKGGWSPLQGPVPRPRGRLGLRGQ